MEKMNIISSVVNKKIEEEEEEEEEDVMLPGFRFHPTDQELVGFYLKRKVERKHFSIDLIKHVDIYKYDPWDLPKVSKISSVTDKEWYFFCRRGRKYRNSIRPNRVTGSGFWKATGIDKPIHNTCGLIQPSTIIIGLKKSLVYYKGSAGKGTKTDWMMHEFRLPTPPLSNTNNDNLPEAEVWTLCRIFKRDVSCRKYGSDWQNKKNHPKQNTTSGSSLEESENMQRKVVMNDEYLVGGTYNHLFAATAGTTQQLHPSNYLSFSNPISSGDEYLGQPQNWDDLRPLVLDHSLYYLGNFTAI